MLALMTGLKEGSPFRSYLGRKTYTSLGPVLGKANDFIRGEEFHRAIMNKKRKKKISSGKTSGAKMIVAEKIKKARV